MSTTTAKRRCYSRRSKPATSPKVMALCDCGDFTLCRWDGGGYSCASCDEYITEVHAAIDQCIIERRKVTKPAKFDRLAYYRAYAAKHRAEIRNNRKRWLKRNPLRH